MADDVTLPGSGSVIATDDIGSGRQVQLVKPVWGPDGTGTMVDVGSGLPVAGGWTAASGSASANNTDLISVDVTSYRWVTVQVTGTFSATVAFQQSNDNSNWVNARLTDMGSSANTPQASFTTSGAIHSGPLYGRYFRIRTLAYTSGTPAVVAVFSAHPSWMPGTFVNNSSLTTSATASNGSADGANGNYWTTVAATAYAYNGAGNATGWDRLRTPTTFKTVSTASTGSTALWTPTSSKKFRIMRYMIQMSADAARTSGGVLDIDLLDSATTMNLTHSLYVPTTSVTTAMGGWSTGWVDLGNGKLSSAANNVLNLSLSAALTSGAVRAVVCGTEE